MKPIPKALNSKTIAVICAYTLIIKVLTELMIDCENCENLVHCRDT